MITNLNPYGQHAWHVVAYHRHLITQDNDRKFLHQKLNNNGIVRLGLYVFTDHASIDSHYGKRSHDDCAHVCDYIEWLIDHMYPHEGDISTLAFLVCLLMDYELKMVGEWGH